MKKELKGGTMKHILTYLFIFLGLVSQSACTEENNSKRKLSKEESTAQLIVSESSKKALNKKHSGQKKKSKKASIIKTIDQLLQKLTAQKPTVIMGTMDYCYFCKKAEPIFKKHAQKYPNIDFYITNGPRTNMAQHVHKESDNKIKIRGYPAFIFIKNGKIIDHLLGINIEQLEQKIKAL